MIRCKDEIEEGIAQVGEAIEAEGNPLVIAARWHCWFEGVHAFSDGNGRTGRALMNYLLLLQDMPLIIVFEEDKQGYYAALEQLDRTGDPTAMVRFLESECVKTWEKKSPARGQGLDEVLGLQADSK